MTESAKEPGLKVSHLTKTGGGGILPIGHRAADQKNPESEVMK